jgi:hypothetical protein
VHRATPNQRATGARCSVSPGLALGCLACQLCISFGCIYFGKCRKECRCPRVADFTGETTATRGLVSKLRGSQHHHLLRYGNNAFLRDGPKVILLKTAQGVILLCLDFSGRVASRPPCSPLADAAHYGLKSDIPPSPKCADTGRMQNNGLAIRSPRRRGRVARAARLARALWQFSC